MRALDVVVFWNSKMCLCIYTFGTYKNKILPYFGNFGFFAENQNYRNKEKKLAELRFFITRNEFYFLKKIKLPKNQTLKNAHNFPKSEGHSQKD